MKAEEFRNFLRREQVLGIIRCSRSENVKDAIEAGIQSGIRILEVTLTTPNALSIVREIRGEFSIDHCRIGVGTVRTPAEAELAIEAGSDFLVTPHFDRELLAAAGTETPVIMGAYTPTEIWSAWTGGAAAIKIYPASVGGTKTISALQGPYPDVPLVPTGGVSPENARQYLDAGAIAIAVGGSVFSADLIGSGDMQALKSSISRLLNGIATLKG